MGALRRLGAGGVISLVAAILLFVLLFAQWYGPPTTVENSLLILMTEFIGGTAWQALKLLPVFLSAVVMAVVVAAYLRLIGTDWTPPRWLGAAVCGLGLVAAALILYRIVDPPNAGPLEGVATERAVRTATYLAFAAALGIAFGGLVTMLEEGGARLRHLDLESSA